MPVPILKQGAILIASVQSALTDSDAERLLGYEVTRAGE